MKLGRLAMIMFTMLHDDTQPATEWKAGQAVQVQSIDDAGTVRYVDGKGRPHDGVVTKRHRDNSYDIRHLSDEETQVEHVEAADIKSLSVWLQAIDSY
ncbi:hypothetical protein B5M09_011154 [Aphanomyces astaci]|uniref:Uncharacterized protein n=1 Tax=Aphanomyces astaci TaxID=112090 RepID=A0A3R7WSS2_APHAT|nr:hypothetical protein B5M09_011154 [Aphanomyces astaci]